MLLLGEQDPAGVVVVAYPPEPCVELLVGLRQVSCRVAADPVETFADLLSCTPGADVIVDQAGDPEDCGPDGGVIGYYLDPRSAKGYRAWIGWAAVRINSATTALPSWRVVCGACKTAWSNDSVPPIRAPRSRSVPSAVKPWLHCMV